MRTKNNNASLALAYKNTVRNFRKNWNIGILLFISSMIFILLLNFNYTVKNTLHFLIEKGFLGQIQIIPGDSGESDLMEHFDKEWDSTSYFTKTDITLLTGILDKYGLSYRTGYRYYGYLAEDRDKEYNLIFGIESGQEGYKEYFPLAEGKYSVKNGGILITSEYAKKFNLTVGDSITLKTKNKDGMNKSLQLTVRGIGDFTFLSLFSYRGLFISSESLKYLAGYTDHEATEIYIVNFNALNNGTKEKLFKEMEQNGYEVKYVKNTLRKSSENKVKELDLEKKELDSVYIGYADDMGKRFQSMKIIIDIFVFVLLFITTLIIAIFIMNIFFQSSLSRLKEIGTLKAFGYSAKDAFLLFVFESLFLTFLYTIPGMLASQVILQILSHCQITIPQGPIAFLLGSQLRITNHVVYSLVIPPIFALMTVLFAFFPAYNASKYNTAGLMRSN